jgi:hypothetical protein
VTPTKTSQPARSTFSIAPSLGFAEDTSRLAEATIAFDAGGSVSATAADGTIFELLIPPQALPADTTIRLTPLTDISGVGGGAVHAVRLEPEGLQLVEWARLTITPASPIPVANQVMFQSTGAGEDVTAALVDPTSEPIVLLLPHFSIGGTAFAEAQGLWLAQRALEPVEALAHEVGRLLQAKRIKYYTDYEDPVMEDLAQYFDAAEQALDSQLMRNATTMSCEATRRYMKGLIDLERQRQIVGISTEESEEATGIKVRKAYDDSFGICERLKIHECRAKRDPGILIAFWVGWDRHLQMAYGDYTARAITDDMFERAQRVCSLSDYRINKLVVVEEFNVRVSIRYSGTKCGGHAGTWVIDSAGTMEGYFGTATVGGPIIVEMGDETRTGTVEGTAKFKTETEGHPQPQTEGHFTGTAVFAEEFAEQRATLELSITSGTGNGYQFGFLDTGFMGPGTLTFELESGDFCS